MTHKIAFITGASRGIGAAIAEKLAKEGFSLAINARREEPLIKKAKELYPNSIIILITNSCFTQRGEISIINKWDKTKLCLDNKIDIVIELVDARIPNSSRNPDIDSLANNKSRLVILNKSDLADSDKTKEWMEYFKKNDITCIYPQE